MPMSISISMSISIHIHMYIHINVHINIYILYHESVTSQGGCQALWQAWLLLHKQEPTNGRKKALPARFRQPLSREASFAARTVLVVEQQPSLQKRSQHSRANSPMILAAYTDHIICASSQRSARPITDKTRIHEYKLNVVSCRREGQNQPVHLASRHNLKKNRN